LSKSLRNLLLLCYPEDVGRKFLRNVVKCIQILDLNTRTMFGKDQTWAQATNHYSKPEEKTLGLDFLRWDLKKTFGDKKTPKFLFNRLHIF
jgi:hypothetical protein